MDPVRFAEEFLYNGRERVFGRRRQGGEGELGGVEGAVERGDVVGSWQGHFLGRELVRPEGRDRLGLPNASECEVRVGPGGRFIAVEGSPMALYLSCERVVVEEHGVIRSKGEWGASVRTSHALVP